MQQGRHHAERQHHAAATEIAHHVDRRGWLVAGAAIGMQCARQRYVVDIMAGRMGIWAKLAPAGHAAIDQPGVDGMALRRAKAQPFGDAGAEALEQRIGTLDEIKHHRPPLGGLEIHADHPPAAQQRIAGIDTGTRPVNPDDLGAMIGQHHAGKGPRPDASQFDHPEPLERTRHLLQLPLLSAPPLPARAETSSCWP